MTNSEILLKREHKLEREQRILNNKISKEHDSEKKEELIKELNENKEKEEKIEHKIKKHTESEKKPFNWWFVLFLILLIFIFWIYYLIKTGKYTEVVDTITIFLKIKQLTP